MQSTTRWREGSSGSRGGSTPTPSPQKAGSPSRVPATPTPSSDTAGCGQRLHGGAALPPCHQRAAGPSPRGRRLSTWVRESREPRKVTHLRRPDAMKKQLLKLVRKQQATSCAADAWDALPDRKARQGKCWLSGRPLRRPRGRRPDPRTAAGVSPLRTSPLTYRNVARSAPPWPSSPRPIVVNGQMATLSPAPSCPLQLPRDHHAAGSRPGSAQCLPTA